MVLGPHKRWITSGGADQFDAQLEVALFAKDITTKKYIAFVLHNSNKALGFMIYVPSERRTLGAEVSKTFP